MTIFEAVKAAVPVRQAAEHYGLKVSRNGMACCPFHNDRHGERHPKSEITLTRKTRTSSSDFALKFTSYFLKPELPVPKNKIYDVIH